MNLQLMKDRINNREQINDSDYKIKIINGYILNSKQLFPNINVNRYAENDRYNDNSGYD
jgi:hypothetical protein